MHRRPLLELLDRYQARYPEDLLRVDHVRHFVRGHSDAFHRHCVEGHITGSAFILDPARQRFLLHHHKKLDRWLQLGGHADGDANPVRVALTEAEEESGIPTFDVLGPPGGFLPLDIDAHVIPKNPKEEAHIHHDVRFLLVAHSEALAHRPEESNDLRWFPLSAMESILEEESLLRMGRRALRWLQEGPTVLSAAEAIAMADPRDQGTPSS